MDVEHLAEHEVGSQLVDTHKVGLLEESAGGGVISAVSKNSKTFIL